MERYWKYVLKDFLTEHPCKRMAVYTVSGVLIKQLLKYCFDNGGELYAINTYGLFSEEYLLSNANVLHLLDMEEAIVEKVSCDAVFLDEFPKNRPGWDFLKFLDLSNCTLIVSTRSLKEEFALISGKEAHFEEIMGEPFGGMYFYVRQFMGEELVGKLHGGSLWHAVEQERILLEQKLRESSIQNSINRTRIYNDTDKKRREDLDEEKKKSNEKLQAIKASKRYRLGSKFAAAGSFLHGGKGKKETVQQKKLKKLDQLAEDLNINLQDTEEVFRLFLNYSPILNEMRMPLSGCQEIVLDQMEKRKNEDRDRYQKREQKALISVIMPTYNRVESLERAIDSVLHQSYQNFELIVVDDFSTDSTAEMMKKYQSESRVLYTMNSHKKGVCGARNTGLDLAHGQFISYLDSDNEWDSEYLLLSVNQLLDHGEFEAIYSAQRVWKEKEGQMYLRAYRYGSFSLSLLENRNYVDLNSYMHTAELYYKYGGFDESLRRMTDWDLMLRYSRHQPPMGYPVVLCDYYEGGSGAARISDVEAENYSFFASKFDGNKLNLPEAEMVLENGYEMYSNANGKIYGRQSPHPAIIIPNYEALDCLKLCLASIRKYSANYDYEVIIVDNDSSEPVKEYLRGISGDNDIQVILNTHNMGFTYAVNQGIRAARADSDYILLNNDAIVTENWLEALYEAKTRIPQAGLIVPRQVLIPRTKTMSIHVPGCNKNREIDVNLSFHHKNIEDMVTYARWGFVELNFAAFFLVMITNACYRQLGLLDEVNGRHYKSDRLYCREARMNGIKVIYTPYAKAYHLLQQSTKQLKARDEKMYDIIFRKNTWEEMKNNGADIGRIASP